MRSIHFLWDPNSKELVVGPHLKSQGAYSLQRLLEIPRDPNVGFNNSRKMFQPGKTIILTEQRTVPVSHVENLSRKLKSILLKRFLNVPGWGKEHPFYIPCNKPYLAVESNEVTQHEYILIKPGSRDRRNGLMNSEVDDDEPFRLSLTQGVSGIGKTINMQMILFNWAEGKENQEVQLVFSLPFRELNLIKGRLNLIELLYKFFPELKDPGIYNLESYRVQFMFDGLDEFRRSLDFKNSPKMTDVMEAFSVPTLLTNLIIGNILPDAQIWISSRPAAVSRIPCQYIHELRESDGFTDPEKEAFFRRAIGDKGKAQAVISFLKESKSLYNLCQIPLFCSNAASVLEKQYIEDKISDTFALTPFYHDLLVLLKMEKHNLKLEIDDMAEFAYKQLIKGNTVFYEEDLRECNFDVEAASLYAKARVPVFREDIGLHQKKIYYFGHTTIQEFFAAVWFLQSNCQQNQTANRQTSFILYRVADLKNAVDMTLRSKSGHLDLFLRFVLGLVQNLSHMSSVATLSTVLSETLEYIKQKVMENPASPRALNLVYCLREVKDFSLENAGAAFITTGLPPDAKYPCAYWSDFAALLMAEVGPYNMPGLEVHKRGDEELLRMLPVVKACQGVILQYHNLTEKSCKNVATVLTSKMSHLRRLDMSFNTLKDSGVELLAAGLAKPHCRLERLNLSGCRMKQKGFAALGKALQSNPTHLRELNLSGNEPGESGVFRLVDGLKVVQCKLQTLKLSNCKLGLELCQALAEFFKYNPQHLRELDVSMNNLGDGGFDVLMDWLEFTQIHKLELYCCQLTEKCWEQMADCLVDVTSLRELNLSNNNLKDKGVKTVDDPFRFPNSLLEKLNLASCGLTNERCYWLANSLILNSTCLKQLDLSRNHLNDNVELAFFRILQHGHFPLETIRLSESKLTEQCNMLFVVVFNSSLKELDLSGNQLGDAGVQTLCIVLTAETFQLERLFLACCGITAAGCTSLAEALMYSRSSITHLGLMGNDTGEEGLRILSAVRDDPRYKLQTLEIND
ncbi:hypothetical protein DPEC_G00173580 [Dallia pectoralis]|uniref:Uncharacterized protein n=1 Tax=Dallia pectoralis TaxID=75939 RepID=A0ACC2GDV9_DALPE|nr:hypothetical protein DPEC_G00173580 [Dallia pectoralis]